MRNKNVPAFPREDYQGDSAPGQIGMTLRDYFAAAALTGLLTQGSRYPEGRAQYAFAIADAMLDERAK